MPFGSLAMPASVEPGAALGRRQGPFRTSVAGFDGEADTVEIVVGGG